MVSHLHRLTAAFGLALGVSLGVLVEQTRAQELHLHGVQAASMDMIRIHAMLRRPDPVTGQPQQEPVFTGNTGTFFFDAFLDTGASGNMLSREWAEGLGVELLLDNTGQPVQFFDVAVSGLTGFHVSEPLYVGLAPYPGPDIEVPHDDIPLINQVFDRQGTSPVRFQVSPDYADGFFTQPRNVIGMPALVGGGFVADLRMFFDPNFTDRDPLDPLWVPAQVHTHLISPGEAFVDGPPGQTRGVPPTDRTLKLTMVDFGQFTHVEPPGSDEPTHVHNPMFGKSPLLGPTDVDNPQGVTTTRLARDGNQYSAVGTWLFDSGAQFSFISEEQAYKIGVRKETNFFGLPNLVDIYTGQSLPGQFQVVAIGAGSDFIIIPGFVLDELRLPAIEGDIVYHNLPIVVLDVLLDDGQGTSFVLDGNIGLNLFLPSMDPNTLAGVGGAFDWLVFDEVAGELRLSIIPEPASFALLLFGTSLLLRRRTGGWGERPA